MDKRTNTGETIDRTYPVKLKGPKKKRKKQQQKKQNKEYYILLVPNLHTHETYLMYETSIVLQEVP